MGAEVRAFDHAHLLGKPATRPIAGLPRRLAALLLMKQLSEGLGRQTTAAKSLLILAGPGPRRRRALPADPTNPHSGAFN